MVPALFLAASLVSNVRGLIALHDMADADRAVRSYQSQIGATTEMSAALSWLARAALDNKQYDRAESYAAETRKLADQFLKTHKVDSDPWLPTAVSAAVEVHAQVRVAMGERGEALAYLRQQLALFGGTSVAERIQKNINLLDLEGKPAPALEIGDWLGSKPVPLAALRGRPVLLFFWAHWCSDCKAEVPILADIARVYGPKGLAIVAPTRLYGYAARGEDASPAVEKNYIEQVRRQYYAALGDLPAPLSTANFLKYGCSTTPTLVLIDTSGMVRYFHPGAISEAELSARIQALLRK